MICYRVYCTSVLASHNIDNLDMDTELNPLFFVNVADIDKLSEETSFVACKSNNNRRGGGWTSCIDLLYTVGPLFLIDTIE